MFQLAENFVPALKEFCQNHASVTRAMKTMFARHLLFGVQFPLTLALFLAVACAVQADWPTLRGNVQHTGYVAADLKPPFRLAWARHFVNERLGTAMEPIVADGKVFVATHSGNIYALDAESGNPLWRFQAHGAFLHSPAFASGIVVAACSDGNVYALNAGDGKLRWKTFAAAGGFAASPAIAEENIFIGARNGDFFALGLKTGRVRWQRNLDAPIRQTAAVADRNVFVTTEGLRVHCLDAAKGKVLWTYEHLSGQTARDYYPVIAKVSGYPLVLVRSNPLLGMGQHLARDRHAICLATGVDDSDWRKIDAWIKSDAARGTPELRAKEQAAIVQHLERNREARTFFLLDSEHDRELGPAPVLWAAGCQGVGTPPVALPDGRVQVFYRTVYGNWNHGVAPLVALGLMDLTSCRIELLEHTQGNQPPWNTFWGTADESQNFVLAGDLLLIVHQGTLSGFDLKSRRLFPIWGNRDTYGGFRNLPWARNEWHGPARGGVAVVGNRIYWLTGSRVLCLVSGEQGKAEDAGIEGKAVPTQTVSAPVLPDPRQTEKALALLTGQAIDRTWAPLFVEPGLAGRDFSFDHSGELFEALAWAYPHLPADLQRRARITLAGEWTNHPPFTTQAWYSLREGQRRESFRVPGEVLQRLGQDKPPHSFGNLFAVGLYAERCRETNRVLAAWPQLKASFDAFAESQWRLDPDKGDLYANRYLASLIACARLAEKAGDTNTARRAAALAEQTTDALVEWWKRSAERLTLPTFNGSAELDPFINRGDALFFRVAPHRHKIALFNDLTPEVAQRLNAKAPQAVEKIWGVFAALCPTWHLAGEERQVHFGENFVDPPDLAMNAFKALAWLRGAPKAELARRVDLPFCHADLYHLTKLALVLEKSKP